MEPVRLELTVAERDVMRNLGIAGALEELASAEGFDECCLVLFHWYFLSDRGGLEVAQELEEACSRGVVWRSVSCIVQLLKGDIQIDEETAFGLIRRADANAKVMSEFFSAARFGFEFVGGWRIRIPDKSWIGVVERHLEVLEIREIGADGEPVYDE